LGYTNTFQNETYPSLDIINLNLFEVFLFQFSEIRQSFDNRYFV